MKITLICLMLLPLFSGHAAIVGEDNRLSYDQLSRFDPKTLAEATATQLSGKYLKEVDKDNFSYPTGQIHNQCPGEKFPEVRTLGGCSGFLIAPDVLVTAGHCRDYSQSDCSDDVWLFRHYSSPPEKQILLKKENLYRCQKVLDFKHDQMADYAVIQLDRPVFQAHTLKIDPRDQVEIHDPVAILGYPLGLPFTYTPGGRVLTKNEMFLQADLDAFKNNSGSAVVNLRTGYVEGILTNSMKGQSMNSLDGCVQSVHHAQGSYKTIMNRLVRIPYLQTKFKLQSKIKKYQIRSSCPKDVTLIAKYRSPKDHSWMTEVIENFKQNQKVENETKYHEVYLHVFDRDSTTLLRGKDFYGFLDSARFEEYGFKRYSLAEDKIELCSH